MELLICLRNRFFVLKNMTVFEEGFKKYFGKIIFEDINIFRADNAGVNSEIADKVLRSNKNENQTKI